MKFRQAALLRSNKLSKSVGLSLSLVAKSMEAWQANLAAATKHCLGTARRLDDLIWTACCPHAHLTFRLVRKEKSHLSL